MMPINRTRIRTERTIYLALMAALALAVAGCSDNGTDPVADDGGGNNGGGDPQPVSFATQIQPVFTASCVGCHGAGGNGGLDLRAGSAYANLVGVNSPTYGSARVVAGDASSSLLYRKMSGAAGVGNVMPPAGALDASTLDLVERWIDEGAEDN
jgi:hypothetical protein